MKVKYVPIGGGLDGTSPPSGMKPNRLRIAINVECKPGGGIRRVEGYTKYDDDEVPGEGAILGLHFYSDKVQAFRNASGGATCSMFESQGSGWTEKKSGLAPNGNYRFVNYDFAGTNKTYGASGVHQAFQWDGTTWTDITSELPTDTPEFIAAYRKHLFLSYEGRLINSSLGDPTTYDALSGATDMIVPQNITGFSTLPNGGLGIFTREGVHILTGTTADDFVANNLSEYGNRVGALPDTIMAMGSQVRFVDSRGITDLGASQVSSDFYDAIISHDVDKIIEGTWINATCSTVVRKKNQYRLFFNDRSGLILVFTGNKVNITLVKFPITVRRAVNAELSNGNEVIYFSSDDGYVYQMESGRNFDGTAIVSYAEPAFTNFDSPSQIKFLRRCRFNVGKNGKNDLTVIPRSFVGTASIPDTDAITPAFYSDDADTLGQVTLGQFVLGGTPIDVGRVSIRRRGEWFSVRFKGTSSNTLPWEIDGITYEYLDGKPIT